MQNYFSVFCRVLLLTAAFSLGIQAEEITSVNNSKYSQAIYSCMIQGDSYAVAQERLSESAETINQLKALQKRQEIRNKILIKAEKYIQSVKNQQGEILPTAFVIEGLLDFGLPASDNYIRVKAFQLSQSLSSDGQAYDSYGYRLHAETAYIHRILRLLSAPQASSHFMGEEEIETVQNSLLAGLPAQAAEFLSQQDFALPTIAQRRASVLGLSSLSSEEYQILANWSEIPALFKRNQSAPEAPLPSMPLVLTASSVSNSSGFERLPIASNFCYSAESYNSRPAVFKNVNRVSGFVLLAQTIVLQI